MKVFDKKCIPLERTGRKEKRKKQCPVKRKRKKMAKEKEVKRRKGRKAKVRNPHITLRRIRIPRKIDTERCGAPRVTDPVENPDPDSNFQQRNGSD